MEKTMIPKLEKTALLDEVAREKVGHLFEPFGIETIGDNGQITIENESIRAQIEYDEIRFDFDKIPRKEEDFNGTHIFVNDAALIRYLDFKPELFYLLKQYRLENKENGSVIDLKDELGENTVYVRKGGSDTSGSGSHHLNTFIKLNIEPKSSAGILTMLHEIGHKKDPNIDPIETMLVDLGKKKDEVVLQQEMIARERYAWAYCLSKIKPFLKGLNVTSEDINIFVHKWNLGNYSASINPKILEKETKNIFSKILTHFKK